jgi:hypothetical protein
MSFTYRNPSEASSSSYYRVTDGTSYLVTGLFTTSTLVLIKFVVYARSNKAGYAQSTAAILNWTPLDHKGAALLETAAFPTNKTGD